MDEQQSQVEARRPLARRPLARRPLARRPLARRPLARRPLAHPLRWAAPALLGTLILLPVEVFAGDKPARGGSQSPRASAPSAPRASAPPSRSAPSRSSSPRASGSRSSSSRSKASPSRSRSGSRSKASSSRSRSGSRSKVSPSRSRSSRSEATSSRSRSGSRSKASVSRSRGASPAQASPSKDSPSTRSRAVESARERAAAPSRPAESARGRDGGPSRDRTLDYRRPSRDRSPAASPSPAPAPDPDDLRTKIRQTRDVEGIDRDLRDPRFQRRIDDGSKTPAPYAGTIRSGGVDRRRDYGPYYYPGYDYGYYGYHGYYGRYGHHHHHGFCPHFSHYGGIYLPVFGSYRVPVVYDRTDASSYEQLGALDLDVKPEDAEIYIDGVYAGIADQYDGYPTYLWLDAGTHELIFYKEGYETLVREFTIYPEAVIKVKERLQPGEAIHPDALTGGAALGAATYGETIVSPPAETAPPAAPDHGRLVFAITPADAAVYIDGHFIGTAGELAQVDAGLIVEPGDHEIEILRPGFDPERIPVTVPAGERVEVAIELQ